MSRQGPRACLLFVAVVALLVSGCEKEEVRVPLDEGDDFLHGTIVARVGGKVITAADLESRLRNQFPDVGDAIDATTERSIREILKMDVDRLCMALAAEEAGVDENHRLFAQYMEMARRKALEDIYREEFIYGPLLPSEEELRQFYDEHLDEYALPAKCVTRHILLANHDDADLAIRRLEAGENFADVAGVMSLDERTRASGGALGNVMRGTAVRGYGKMPEFVEQVFDMDEGETRIIESEHGVHVVRVEGKIEDSRRTFEQVREGIRDRLFRTPAAAAYDSTLQALRAGYTARILDENLVAYLGWRRAEPEEELFARAQAEQNPVKRIAIYREYLEKFAHSEHAAEAQFMIGFIYAEELKNEQNARIEINEFLKKYPDSELVPSARYMLEELSARKGTK